MDWMQKIDAYCERTDFTFWAEPLNAVTNLGYLLVALIYWQRMQGSAMGRVLSFILALIAIGSFLFHTTATAWAGAADSAPIGVFILVYLFALNRDVLGWPLWAALLGTVLYLPYAALVVPILDSVPFLTISDFYWTVPLALIAYALGLRRRAPGVARGLAAGAALLAVSISVRSLDLALCETLPVGTHFLWHLLNAVMFVVVLETYRRPVLAQGPRGR